MATTENDRQRCVCGDSECTIPYGYCHCGCGQTTNVATKWRPDRGVARGGFQRYLLGHQKRIKLKPEEARPFKIDEVYCRLIPLSQGMYAIVDSADYEWLMQWKWSVKKCSNGYYAHRHLAVIDGKKKTITMHQQISGDKTKVDVDHKNGLPLDMRRKNLRPANDSQNMSNTRLYASNTSGHKGVSKTRYNKWRVRICVANKSINIGTFASKDEAIAARDSAATKYHGEFARSK